MKFRIILAVLLIAISGAFYLSAMQPAVAGPTLGEPAPDFVLTDLDGQEVALSSYKGKYVVLEWTNYECPFVKKHYNSGNMQSLQAKFTGEDVIWLSINSSAPGKQGNFPPEKWKEMLAEKKVAASKVLLDPDGKVGKLYLARTTPEMFVIDPQGNLIYMGAIDDKSGHDPAEIKTAKNFVQTALEEARAGKPVSTPITRSYGCSVKY